MCCRLSVLTCRGRRRGAGRAGGCHRYEALGEVAGGGSENARLLGDEGRPAPRGVLDTVDVTAPLRPLTAAEATQVIDESERLARTATHA